MTPTKTTKPQPQLTNYDWVTEYNTQIQRITKLEEQNKTLQSQIQHLTEITENNTNILTNIRITQETERALRKQDEEERESRYTIQIGLISSITATVIAFIITNIIKII